MVGRGEFLERMTVIPTEGAILEGLYHSGGEGEPVVLAPPHPALGGTMESAVLAELAWALTRAGHATLRFNYRGVGASTGKNAISAVTDGEAPPPPSPQALDEAYADLCAAIAQHLETCGAPRCAVVGYSFGAHVAARAGVEHEAVDRVLLIAPPVKWLPFDFDALARAGVPTFIACGERDRWAPPDEVDARSGEKLGVFRVPGAGHAFSSGLPALGRWAVSCFPEC